VVDQLYGIQEEASTMKVCHDDMQQRLIATKARIAGLLKKNIRIAHTITPAGDTHPTLLTYWS